MYIPWRLYDTEYSRIVITLIVDYNTMVDLFGVRSRNATSTGGKSAILLKWRAQWPRQSDVLFGLFSYDSFTEARALLLRLLLSRLSSQETIRENSNFAGFRRPRSYQPELCIGGRRLAENKCAVTQRPVGKTLHCVRSRKTPQALAPKREFHHFFPRWVELDSYSVSARSASSWVYLEFAFWSVQVSSYPQNHWLCWPNTNWSGFIYLFKYLSYLIQ